MKIRERELLSRLVTIEAWKSSWIFERKSLPGLIVIAQLRECIVYIPKTLDSENNAKSLERERNHSNKIAVDV